MPMLRVIKCTICNIEKQELDMGSGFPGWCIINGIGEKEPEPNKPLTNENMTSYYCPECRSKISEFITNLQERG